MKLVKIAMTFVLILLLNKKLLGQYKRIDEINSLSHLKIDLFNPNSGLKYNKVFNKRFFLAGQRVTVGTTTKAYRGKNIPIVGDFNADGYDDIGVKWTSDTYNGEWVISLNDKNGNFLAGQRVTVGTTTKAYRGKNIPIVGDFNADGYDDIGVKWISDTYNGEWVISKNKKEDLSEVNSRVTVRLGLIFLNFKDQVQITNEEIETTIELLKRHYEINFYNRLNLEIKYKLINLPNRVDWVGGLNQPVYNLDSGNLENGSDFPIEEEFIGYKCRFNFPGSTDEQIIFKNYKGALGWIPSQNPNVFRNYCQIAERNFAKNPLYNWYANNKVEFNEFMNWVKAPNSSGPYLGFIGRGLPGGGDRDFEKTLGDKFPLKIGNFKMTKYLYGDYSLAFINHEIGHFLGHKRELYGNCNDACEKFDKNGSLEFYDVMACGNGFPSYSAFTKWRFGLFKARYITNKTKSVTVKLPPSLNAKKVEDSFVIIHPNPIAYPDEIFVLENRRRTIVNVKGGDYTMNDLGNEGLMIYHIKSKNNINNNPMIDLENDSSFCPRLVPFQSLFNSTSNPNSNFYDGIDSKLSIKELNTDDDNNILVEISFN